VVLTAADVQKRILERTGDFDPTTGDPLQGGGGYLEQQIAGVWAQYADKAYVAPRLLELYVERDLAIRYRTALQHLYHFRDSDADFARDERFDHLETVVDEDRTEIERIETIAAANRSPAVGQLTTTAPMGRPWPFGLDANSPRYGGSPYYRRPWGYP
jgi:hypothetical protein